MPIYEYESSVPKEGCRRCLNRFEIIQKINDDPLFDCPYCGQKVRKVISWCRSAIIEISDEHRQVEKNITEYEKQGMFSHAAELADKRSEKVKDNDMKTRALENYKRAGYDLNTLEKHSKPS